MISHGAIGHLPGPLGERFFASPGNFVMDGLRGAARFPAGWRAAPAATFPSYAALQAALDAERVPAEVRAIIYDNESWKFTPKQEQLDPERFEKLAAEAIHRHHRLFIATPAADLVPVLNPNFERGRRYDEYLRLGIAAMAARYADIYEIQAQGSLPNPVLYIQFVKSAAAQARKANRKVLVFAGLSTNPSGRKVTAGQLYQAVQATRGDVDGYWLNIPGGGAYCPRCGQPQPQVAVELLRRLGWQ